MRSYFKVLLRTANSLIVLNLLSRFFPLVALFGNSFRPSTSYPRPSTLNQKANSFKNNCEEFCDPRLVTLDPRPSTKRQTPVVDIVEIVAFRTESIGCPRWIPVVWK